MHDVYLYICLNLPLILRIVEFNKSALRLWFANILDIPHRFRSFRNIIKDNNSKIEIHLLNKMPFRNKDSIIRPLHKII